MSEAKRQTRTHLMGLFEKIGVSALACDDPVGIARRFHPDIIQAPASLLGLIGAGFALVPGLLALPVGRLVNRLGERRLMLAGSLVTVAASLVFLFGAGSITGLLLANAILGPATSVA